MISFSCSQCGMKFQVKDEFAGRQTRCSTCKQPLVVPEPDKTQAYVLDGPLDGPPSSLAQASVEGGVTLHEKAVPPGQPSVRDLLARREKGSERYLLEKEIARGGMGAVLRAVDCDIRREVAVKYLLDQTDPGKKRRFVEEAQITGQLEHPNIVPVHELGVDSQGRLFFAMKMVKGHSLAQILKDLRDRDAPRGSEQEWPLGRLLTLFVGICNALAYAHARGVVHRDLKPANIMVGDFGEVYVMDWGLAKVLHAETAPLATVVNTPAVVAPAAIPVAGSSITSASGKVATSREGEADLTQEGAVLGTPVYMPPEQATGNVQATDQRSDVYSLGAILYEVLTFEPPIDRQGGHLAILLRVAQGEIVPPERRAPGRWVPPELSAVTMKALARQPQDRYPHVEALRRDIELFQEGRSVSARTDTFREVAWKLVKRNRAASIAAALVLLVLLGSLGTLLRAWYQTGQAYALYQQEQQEKDQRTRAAAPALVMSARFAAERRQFDEALEQLEVALRYDPGNTAARLLKGQLLIIRRDFAQAHQELQQYLRLRPEDAGARTLAELCQRPQPDHPDNALRFAAVFNRQEAYALQAHLLLPYGKTSDEARVQLRDLYQKRIEENWPGLGKRLTITVSGLSLNLEQCWNVRDLAPLQGMPLTSLTLGGAMATGGGIGVEDLSPLRGMPLEHLNLLLCGKVRDLTPLQGCPLKTIIFSERPADPTPLRSIKTLETINYMPADAYWKAYDERRKGKN